MIYINKDKTIVLDLSKVVYSKLGKHDGYISLSIILKDVYTDDFRIFDEEAIELNQAIINYMNNKNQQELKNLGLL